MSDWNKLNSKRILPVGVREASASSSISSSSSSGPSTSECSAAISIYGFNDWNSQHRTTIPTEDSVRRDFGTSVSSSIRVAVVTKDAKVLFSWVG